MADYLLYFQIRMFFSRIVIKERFQVIDEVMLIVGYLKIGHYYVVGSVGPAAFNLVIDPICFTWKVKSLHDEFAALLEKWTPLDWSHRPVENVLVDKFVERMAVLAPLGHEVWFGGVHWFAGNFIVLWKKHVFLSGGIKEKSSVCWKDVAKVIKLWCSKSDKVEISSK